MKLSRLIKFDELKVLGFSRHTTWQGTQYWLKRFIYNKDVEICISIWEETREIYVQLYTPTTKAKYVNDFIEFVMRIAGLIEKE